MTGLGYPDRNYVPYSVMQRSDVHKVLELVGTTIRSSRLWASESSESVFTNCVTVLLSKQHADCHLIVRVGFEEGHAITKALGLGEPELGESR